MLIVGEDEGEGWQPPGQGWMGLLDVWKEEILVSFLLEPILHSGTHQL